MRFHPAGGFVEPEPNQGTRAWRVSSEPGPQGGSTFLCFRLAGIPTASPGPQPLKPWPAAVQWQWEWFRQSLWKAFSSRERQLGNHSLKPLVVSGGRFLLQFTQNGTFLCIYWLFVLWTSHLEGFCGCSKRLFCWVLVLGLWIWRFNAALLSSRRAGAAPGPASYAGMLIYLALATVVSKNGLDTQKGDAEILVKSNWIIHLNFDPLSGVEGLIHVFELGTDSLQWVRRPRASFLMGLDTQWSNDVNWGSWGWSSLDIILGFPKAPDMRASVDSQISPLRNAAQHGGLGP